MKNPIKYIAVLLIFSLLLVHFEYSNQIRTIGPNYLLSIKDPVKANLSNEQIIQATACPSGSLNITIPLGDKKGFPFQTYDNSVCGDNFDVNFSKASTFNNIYMTFLVLLTLSVLCLFIYGDLKKKNTKSIK